VAEILRARSRVGGTSARRREPAAASLCSSEAASGDAAHGSPTRRPRSEAADEVGRAPEPEVVQSGGGEARRVALGADEDDVASPKTDAQVEGKFHALTRDALGRERAERILEHLWNLERASKLAELTPLFAIG